jgi:hypothetical protein
MTLQEFNTLSLEHRCDAIYEWGFYLGKHKIENTNKVLYLMNGFFAEMIISLNDNKVLDITVFLDKDLINHPSYHAIKNSPFFMATSVKPNVFFELKAA